MIDECVEYFKAKPGFNRFLKELRQKWQSYGCAVGTIVLSQATDEEREALGEFLGTHFYDEKLRIAVKQFVKALGETRFATVSLETLLQAYFGDKLEKNQAKQQRLLTKRQAFFVSQAEALGEPVATWLDAVQQTRQYGWLMLRRGYQADRYSLIAVLKNIAALWSFLQKQRWARLAVVSAEVSGNPHYFDYKSLAGRLLVAFLSYQQRQNEPQTAAARLELYYSSGLMPDDMSSATFLYGVSLWLTAEPHPSYEAFIRQNEPYCVTLLNLAKINRASCAAKKIFVVENQTVFSILCDKVKTTTAALMCTSGQLRTASLIVIDWLAAAGCDIYYSGDLDPEGITIADKLCQRQPGRVFCWRMGSADYINSLSDEAISDSRLKQLERVVSPQLQTVAAEMQARKKAGYQELLLSQLIADVLSEVR